MSGDPGIFSLSRRRFVQALAMLAAQARWPLRLAADGNNTAPLELWYDRPASQWVQALPIGNGRLGAMIFGEVIEEHLQLNDDTLWSGAPRDWDNPKAKDVLPDIRRAVAEGRYVDADQLAKGMMGPVHGGVSAARRSARHLRARRHRPEISPRARPDDGRLDGDVPGRRDDLHA